MTVIPTSIFTLFERFPDRKKTLKALFERSETFKTLCDDHRKCLEAIQYWNRSPANDAGSRKREYESLIRELEEEIADALNDLRY